MKIITIILGIILCQYTSIGQNDSSLNPTTNSSGCFVEYSEDLKSLTCKQSAQNNCREMTILALPPQTNSLSVLNVDFTATGAYTFTKDSSLQIYEDKDVYIEDMLTGKVFDLKTSSSYSFKVNRHIPDRFVLHIDNMLMRYSISSN